MSDIISKCDFCHTQYPASDIIGGICPVCDEEDRVAAYCKEKGWKPVGLSADWVNSAWCIKPLADENELILFDEEDGTYSLFVAGFFEDERVHLSLFKGTFMEVIRWMASGF